MGLWTHDFSASHEIVRMEQTRIRSHGKACHGRRDMVTTISSSDVMLGGRRLNRDGRSGRKTLGRQEPFRDSGKTIRMDERDVPPLKDD